jgi:hypothetical protein
MKSCNFLPHICVNEVRPTGIRENHILLQRLTTYLLACSNPKPRENKGVCHTMALPFIYIQKYLKAKEELWKLKYFTMHQYNLPKTNPLKETKILQGIL